MGTSGALARGLLTLSTIEDYSHGGRHHYPRHAAIAELAAGGDARASPPTSPT